MAIARISSDLADRNGERVVHELANVTGQSYGLDRRAWDQWWQRNKDSWQIPEVYLKPWDEQEDLN